MSRIFYNSLLRVLSSSIISLCFLSLMGCSDSAPTNSETSTDPREEDPIGLDIYIPEEFSDINFDDNTETWSFERSQESEHFIVFWEDGYGNEHPVSESVSETYRVNIDDLLEKAELFYDYNVHDMKFAVTGEGQSYLDTYKMMIFLYHTDEWMAFGAGYDDVIGALWISPNTAQPAGSVVAHEIGHSFQYQVYADLGGGAGFRYGYGGNGGNTFWESTAQWQAWYAYPEEIFGSHNFQVYTENYHRHTQHEDYRYASYFLHYYWTDKHGLDIIARIWREAEEPEDPIKAYMRITGISTEEMNNEMYEAAAKLTTWDIDEIRNLGEEHIGKHTYSFETLDDSSHRVSYDHAPGTTGYNVIPLNVPENGETVSVEFTGESNAEGFNPVDASIAGWRYGFVALLENGQRVYGDMHKEAEGTVSFDLPGNTDRLWFVVTGAPDVYSPHPWDDNNSNDEQWPYTVQFTNTNITGLIDISDDGTPEDAEFTFDISFPADDTNYTGADVEADPADIARAFQLQPGEITSAIGEDIQFYGVENDGTLNPNTTANGYGHWFDENGNVVNWGEDARVFSEFDESGFRFRIGQYPDESSPGDSYTIKQALVYEYQPGLTAQVTYEFIISIE